MNTFYKAMVLTAAFFLGFFLGYDGSPKMSPPDKANIYHRGFADGYSVCNEVWSGKIKTVEQATERARKLWEEVK